MDNPSIQTYISMLRGINVGGHRKIKMDELKALYESLQLQNVNTYIQSGNVIFQSSIYDCKQLEELISKAIKERFNFDVPSIVKNIEDFRDIYENNSFLLQNKDSQHLYTVFLSDYPHESVISKISNNQGEDLFIVYKSAIYLFCPNGYGRTKLTNTFFENSLKMVATTRGWATVCQLYQIAQSLLVE